MAEKRSISVRKIIQTLVTLVLVTACIFASISAAKIQNKKTIKSINITIKNEQICHFIDKQEVEKMLLSQRHIDLKSTTIQKIDLRKMEQILLANPWIENAQVFVDNNRILNVYVQQRIPEIRIFQQNGDSYYIDSSLHRLPLSDNYAHYTMLFINVPEIKDDSTGAALEIKMLRIADFIRHSAFWNAQIAQVVVNNDKDFELSTVLGNQRILIGDTTSLNDKMANVFAFYQHIINKIGWDKYEVIDARFGNQIVASPSLPWKAPVDRALTNINWVKSIVGNVPVQETTSEYPLTSDVKEPEQTKPIMPVTIAIDKSKEIKKETIKKITSKKENSKRN
jgi:cell division protein FtsQ